MRIMPERLPFYYLCEGDVKQNEKESLRMQSLHEYNQWRLDVGINGKAVVLDKSQIPKGKQCNGGDSPLGQFYGESDRLQWCPYLVGVHCLKYHQWTRSDGQMSDYFHKHLRLPQCKADYPKGYDCTQMELWEG